MNDWKEKLQQLKYSFGRDSNSIENAKQRKSSPLPINIGIDFGTSFTKVCFRDSGAEHSGVILFQTQNGNAPVIPSIVDISSDGLLHMRHEHQPDQKTTSAQYLKMLLVGDEIERDHDDPNKPWLRDANTCRGLSAWFLSRTLTASIESLKRTETQRLKNRELRLSANVGVPVAHYDSPHLDVFCEVLGVAWSWFNLGNAPTSLVHVSDAYQTAKRDLDLTLTDFHAVPEIAAAIQSFVIARSAKPGFYVYFDIGGGTVDGVAFRFENPHGEKHVNFYSGVVRSLGLEVRNAHLAQQGAEDNEGFRLDVQKLVAAVIMKAKQKSGRNWQEDSYQRDIPRLQLGGMKAGNMRPLIVFLGGYGAHDHWYQSAIRATYLEFKHKNAGIPPYALQNVPTPADLDLTDIGDFTRHAIAYGLSVPFGEGPEIKLPSQIDDPPPPRQWRPPFGDYMDSKDAYD